MEAWLTLGPPDLQGEAHDLWLTAGPRLFVHYTNGRVAHSTVDWRAW
jgi:hypothetical protein